MKIIALTIIIILSGCTSGDNVRTKTQDFKSRCIGGVEYFLFKESVGSLGYGFMSPKYNGDGSISLCNKYNLGEL